MKRVVRSRRVGRQLFENHTDPDTEEQRQRQLMQVINELEKKVTDEAKRLASFHVAETYSNHMFHTLHASITVLTNDEYLALKNLLSLLKKGHASGFTPMMEEKVARHELELLKAFNEMEEDEE